jgi:DNA-binding transcriptional ArsR family regulator
MSIAVDSDREIVLTVTAVGPYGAGEGTVDVPVGRPVTFNGCQSDCCPAPDLVVPGAAGAIEAGTTAWSLTNHCQTVTLRIWSLEDPDEQVRVRPGQTVSPPFDLAGVAGAAGHVLVVFGPDPVETKTGYCVADVPVAWGLNPTSRRHDVMVALVRPRMTGDSTTPLPTTREIGDLLGMSHRTVQEHLGELTRVLGLTESTDRRPGWIRAALATFAANHPYVPAPDTSSPW